MPYVPSEMTGISTVDQLRQYVQRELLAIARELTETQALELRPSYVEPLRPREGMIAFADGTEWDPGSGAGSYEYRGGSWVKL